MLGSVSRVGATTLLVHDRSALGDARSQLPGRVGVVMTMGALHDGHLSLVRLARQQADHVVVTLFVNPLQFGPGEDLASYPRPLEADLAVCAEAGVDVVFVPAPATVHPHGMPSVRISAGEMGERWEGVSRPGHFDGVLTVVTVLLHLVRPDVAVFGRKDRQQLALIQAMVRDLALTVDIVAGDTVRESDGLALSSRNAYLDPVLRAAAVAVPNSLAAAQQVAATGAAAGAVVAAAREQLDRAAAVEVDYCALVRPDDLVEVGPGHHGPAVLLVAARLGTTRLIDNADVHLLPADGSRG